MVNVTPTVLIPDEQWETFPPAARAIIIRLGARVDALESQVASLQAEVADLRARLSRNSSNSSKPPSSDRPKIQKRKEKTGKPRGGVPGHEAHFREKVPPERVDQTESYYPTSCRGCGRALEPSMAIGEPLRHQVTELPVVRAVITEHQLYRCMCPECKTSTSAELPAEVPMGEFGPRFTAFVALLVGRFRLSRREAAQLVGTLADTTIAPSTVVKLCERTSEALESPVAAIAEEVRTSPVAYVDETGSFRKGKLTWLWVAVAATATLFHVADRRTRAARKDLLGENYRGIVVSDRLGVYGDIPAYDRALCHAHLKRDLIGLMERGGEVGHVAGVVRAEQKRLFKLYWARESGEMGQAEVMRKLAPLKARLVKVLKKARRHRKPGWALFKAMWKLWPALFTFVELTGVEGTNSKAERALRPAVIWRRTSIGTDSLAGDRFVERMLTVSATCYQRRVNLFSYLRDAVEAHFKGVPAPLVPRAP